MIVKYLIGGGGYQEFTVDARAITYTEYTCNV